MARRTQADLKSNTYRFFVPEESIREDALLLHDAQLAHQLGVVLRLTPGKRITVLDGLGWEYSVVIQALDRHTVQAQIISREQAAGEPQIRITLFCPLIRAERFEWLLQKGTELGVARFVPVLYQHTVHGDSETAGRKSERWERIIREAAEQSWRGRLPELSKAQPFGAALQQAAASDLALLLWEGKQAQALQHVLQPLPGITSHNARIAILSGPEGGLSQAEVEQAFASGVVAVTLGKRILRAETAPLVAISALLYAAGEF